MTPNKVSPLSGPVELAGITFQITIYQDDETGAEWGIKVAAPDQTEVFFGETFATEEKAWEHLKKELRPNTVSSFRKSKPFVCKIPDWHRIAMSSKGN